MAFFKRRPHVPNRGQNTDGGEGPPKRKSRNKYDDYVSADGPSGKLVYKRPNMKRKSYQDDGGDSPPRRFASPRGRSSDGDGGSDRPKSFRDNRDRDDYGHKGKGPSSGGYGRGQRNDYGGKPYRKDRDDDQGQGSGPKKSRSFGSGPKREGFGRSHDSGSKWEGSSRSHDSGHKREGSSRPHGSGPKREGFTRSHGPLGKPAKASLKPSQVLVLKTIVDREIPSSLKRLGEAEDKCLSVSQKLLDYADTLANVKLYIPDLLEDLPEDSDSRDALEQIGRTCDLIAQSLNVEASIGDLVGQRLIKVSDFLESSTSIFTEIIEEHGGAEAGPKSPRGKLAPEKTDRGKTARDKADQDKSKTHASFSLPGFDPYEDPKALVPDVMDILASVEFGQSDEEFNGDRKIVSGDSMNKEDLAKRAHVPFGFDIRPKYSEIKNGKRPKPELLGLGGVKDAYLSKQAKQSLSEPCFLNWLFPRYEEERISVFSEDVMPDKETKADKDAKKAAKADKADKEAKADKDAKKAAK
ncbi:MAG: hypothetical protein LBF38_11375, partial [Deltaproteobacteria bacterium]|nr:hypothetical protein [Deltaproteobacteria bacterium]